MMKWSLLDQIRSQHRLYRAAKRVQPLYFRWLLLRAIAGRALVAKSWMSRVFQNPLRTAIAHTLSHNGRDGDRAGLRGVFLYPDTRARRVLPPGLQGDPHSVFAQVKHADSGPGIVYTLQDGRVWGPGGAVISRDRRLFEDLSPIIRLSAEAHPLFRRPMIGRPKHLDGCLGTATGPSPDNLSHWFFGILPRVSLLKQWDPAFEKLDWVLTPSLKMPFHAECLRRFGIPRSKMIEAQRDTFLEAEEIAAPSFVSAAYVAPSWFLNDLRHRFDDVPPVRHAPRIYISRRDAHGRRVDNEAAVIRLLTSYAFQTVQLERLSFLDQVALFKGANIVVAPHGAGLTHLAFAHAETAAVELFSPSYVNPMYWCVADELGLQYRCCIGSKANGPVRHDLVRDDLTVDIEMLAATVKSLTSA